VPRFSTGVGAEFLTVVHALVLMRIIVSNTRSRDVEEGTRRGGHGGRRVFSRDTARLGFGSQLLSCSPVDIGRIRSDGWWRGIKRRILREFRGEDIKVRRHIKIVNGIRGIKGIVGIEDPIVR